METTGHYDTGMRSIARIEDLLDTAWQIQAKVNIALCPMGDYETLDFEN